MAKRILILLIASIAFGAALGYFFGYDQGFERAEVKSINSFQECKDAGNPIMESYPERCMTPDGRSFDNPEHEYTPEGEEDENDIPVSDTPSPRPPLGEPVACTMDAFICPDGTALGRTGPNCTFPPCP